MQSRLSQHQAALDHDIWLWDQVARWYQCGVEGVGQWHQESVMPSFELDEPAILYATKSSFDDATVTETETPSSSFLGVLATYSRTYLDREVVQPKIHKHVRVRPISPERPAYLSEAQRCDEHMKAFFGSSSEQV